VKSKIRSVVLTITLLTLGCGGCAEAGPFEEAKTAYDHKDYATALGIWRPLAVEGNAEAQRFVGILYENGLALPRDQAQAVALFRKAAAQGDAEAEYRLGFSLVDGAGIPRDVSRGVSLMEKAGKHGYIRSFRMIGDFYRAGFQDGVPKDEAKAVAWYRMAADQGDEISQARLGLAYEYGQGVAKDISQAISWYRKAASQGDDVSMAAPGRIYEHGDGVDVNKPVALCWYKKAAQRGGSAMTLLTKPGIDRLEQQTTSEDVESCQ
jgi:TPR repeat protein